MSSLYRHVLCPACRGARFTDDNRLCPQCGGEGCVVKNVTAGLDRLIRDMFWLAFNKKDLRTKKPIQKGLF